MLRGVIDRVRDEEIVDKVGGKIANERRFLRPILRGLGASSVSTGN